jgi:hypothetical protein
MKYFKDFEKEIKSPSLTLFLYLYYEALLLMRICFFD